MADPQIAQWFYTVDKNKTGKLSAVELQQALRNNNYTTFDIQVVQVSVRIKKSFLAISSISWNTVLSKYYFE